MGVSVPEYRSLGQRDCWVVVPAHNRHALTVRCLDRIFGEAPACNFGIAIIDDASNSAERRLIEENRQSADVIYLSRQGGFAAACNTGAAATTGKFIVFLNNDTLPQRGWLDELITYADTHPEAGVIGSRLLFPDDSVQHAGVIIGRDGLPRHIYAGFPGSHPAVMKSRRFQAVTGACMLMRRSAFDEAGGFDEAFRNGYEDIDLCLRMGLLGHEVHYCHTSVVHHLESASRGRRRADFESNIRKFRHRWRSRVRPDELDYYINDGLLRIEYERMYPLRLYVAPELAAIQDRDEVEKLLTRYARRAGDLLEEVVRLTVESITTDTNDARLASGARPPRASVTITSSAGYSSILQQVERIEHQLADVQDAIRSASTPVPAGSQQPRQVSGPALGYRRDVRLALRDAGVALPAGAAVAVLSRGDDELLEIPGVHAMHFPQSDDGEFLGYHPGNSEEAITLLEQLRSRGAEYLMIPRPSLWWLTEYPEFAGYLASSFSQLPCSSATLIYDMRCIARVNNAQNAWSPDAA